ncbi:MAG: translocation/assembly module TamB domain-containing protein, partial [Desulfomonilia bacterium]
ARLDITNVRLKGEALPDWHIDAHLEEHTIQATGRLNFDIEASYDLNQDLFSAAARFDQTDLSPYFTLMGRKNLTGTISGSVDAHGNVRNLMDSRVQMNVSSIQVFYTGTEIIRSRDVHASFQDGILVLPSSRIVLGSEGWMDIRGEGRTDATLRITTEGTIPLEVLGSFQEDPNEAEGSLRFSAQITGTLSKPEFIAVLRLQDIGYRIPSTGQKIHDLNGIIRITESDVTFENIEGMLETGAMTAGGTITLSELNPSGFDLTLRAVNLPVAVPDTMDMTIDGNLSLTGPADSSLLAGEILILEGTYYRDVKLNLLTGVSRLLYPERRTSVQAPVQVPESVENIELQIVVKRRGTVAVDNNIAYLEINPDLLIRGTMIEPVITGRMSVLEGTITYQKKDFVITKGVIDFVNPYTTEASIDITGEVPVRTWTIFLGITGTFEEMVFSLRSDPPEEDADILSLLAFGKTTGEFIQNAGGTLTSTSGMIAELVASTFSEDIKEVTTLDIFELESVQDASTDDADAMRLLLGKELSRRMTIKYEMETRNSEMTQRAIAEYKLLENLLLNGFQDNKGIFGADMQFRLEFR